MSHIQSFHHISTHTHNSESRQADRTYEKQEGKSPYFGRREFISSPSDIPLHSSAKGVHRAAELFTDVGLESHVGTDYPSIVYSEALFGTWGQDSSVGIMTRYRLGGPEIEYRWGRHFPHTSRPALGPTPPTIQ